MRVLLSKGVGGQVEAAASGAAGIASNLPGELRDVGAQPAEGARRPVRPQRQGERAVRGATAGGRDGATDGAPAAPQNRHHLGVRRAQHVARGGQQLRHGHRAGARRVRARSLPGAHRHRLRRRLLLHQDGAQGASPETNKAQHWVHVVLNSQH